MNAIGTGSPPAAVCILGPTASGKSALALALADRFAVEIISVDSAQVYRGMDAGTAKPSPEERRQVPHHLIDILDPVESYSAAAFSADAPRLIAEVRARGRLPLLVGGTMLYFHALRSGLDALPAADQAVRAALQEDMRRVGLAGMHARLAALDPVSAQRIRPTDPQRIQRALEVIQATGRPMSEQLGSRAAAPVDALWISLVPGDRALLHKRIAQRFDWILSSGLVAELRALRQRFSLNPDLPAMRCVGYRQAWKFLDGACNEHELRETGIAATRQLAKRQLTWLRKLASDASFDPFDPATLQQLTELLRPLARGSAA